MTRDLDYVGTRAASPRRTRPSGPPTAYPIRDLVAYQRLIERGERIDPAAAVADYARANPDVDLDARSTFTDWQLGTRFDDTVERPGGFRH